MFIFEDLQAYKKSLIFVEKVDAFLEANKINRRLEDQLYRAASSITLNLAEGAGRFTNADKRNFYIVARGSIYECVAVFQLLRQTQKISDADYGLFYVLAEELSKMTNGLIGATE